MWVICMCEHSVYSSKIEKTENFIFHWLKGKHVRYDSQRLRIESFCRLLRWLCWKQSGNRNECEKRFSHHLCQIRFLKSHVSCGQARSLPRRRCDDVFPKDAAMRKNCYHLLWGLSCRLASVARGLGAVISLLFLWFSFAILAPRSAPECQKGWCDWTKLSGTCSVESDFFMGHLVTLTFCQSLWNEMYRVRRFIGYLW